MENLGSITVACTQAVCCWDYR